MLKRAKKKHDVAWAFALGALSVVAIGWAYCTLYLHEHPVEARRVIKALSRAVGIDSAPARDDMGRGPSPSPDREEE